jgi:IS5 family transposase
MLAPQKRTTNPKTDYFSLCELLQNLDCSAFRSLLPRGACPAETLYYPPESLLRALLLRQLLNLSYRDLEQFFLVHPLYAEACGFPSGYIPDASYYCKFFTQLTAEVLQAIAVSLLYQLCHYLNLSCSVIAVDSSAFRAWANSFSKRADPAARTGKSSTKGWFFGYKLHLVVDVLTELPVAIILTPGNRYDGHYFTSLLQQTQSNLITDIQVVLADKGYDAGYNYLTVVEDLGALPLIPKRGAAPSVETSQLTLDSFFQLPRANSSVEALPSRKQREKIYRTSPPLPRTDPLWKRLLPVRLAVERVISRFKAFFCPEQLRVTGIKRVTTWCLVGWVGLLASALFCCQRQRLDLVRSFPFSW